VPRTTWLSQRAKVRFDRRRLDKLRNAVSALQGNNQGHIYYRCSLSASASESNEDHLYCTTNQSVESSDSFYGYSLSVASLVVVARQSGVI
jgi:hypothetical protein